MLSGSVAAVAADVDDYYTVRENYRPTSHYLAIVVISIASAEALVLAAPAEITSTAWKLPSFGSTSR